MLTNHSPLPKLRPIVLVPLIALCSLLAACTAGPTVSNVPSITATASAVASPTRVTRPTATMAPLSTLAPTATAVPTPPSTATPVFADTATIHARSTVPILCYHQVRDWTVDDATVDKAYIMPIKTFAEQMDFLDQQGYHTISPDQLYAYLTTGASLPAKPVLLTFDDGHGSEWTNAVPVLQKHHFQATFFIMTVVLDKPHWLSSDQVKQLDQMGMTIAAHTWDHHRVTRYSGDDWKQQITLPTKELADLTGHPIKYFAYPYGLWNTAAFPYLKDAGFLAAFQLSDKMDPGAPLLTIRRIIASGTWKLQTFQDNLAEDF
ncbi:MAG: polysaccharide deacetylase family protein [Herpetosiphonaceae bacterium]|nr:polysaccharide deacetylase family protein [Herpetosiphonaceae bacterium]